jgi:hypothetical protein
MRKPDWRDSWIITALCTFASVVYMVQDWQNGFHIWAAAAAGLFLLAMLVCGFKFLQKYRRLR